MPVDVRNRPFGVRLLDIGQDGVLVPKAQTERTILVDAEPWVEATARPFHAVGKAEPAGTEKSTEPFARVVVSSRGASAAAAVPTAAANLSR